MSSKQDATNLIQDHLAPLLIERARYEMIQKYKPGMVEETGQGAIEVIMGPKPILTIEGTFPDEPRKEFYGKVKICIPLKPVLKGEMKEKEILQNHVITHVHEIRGDGDAKITYTKDTVILYMIDFWITKNGQVWIEQAEGVWNFIMQLPLGLLQESLLNFRTNLTSKFTV